MCLALSRKQIFFLLIFTCTAYIFSHAQDANCIFKDTTLSFNFGTEKAPNQFRLLGLKNYKQAYSDCPDDGFYAYSARTSNCFLGDWVTLNQDHTPGDVDGKMMLVNASQTASDFFVMALDGFKPSTNYEFSVWLLNVCKINGGCPPLPPDILISLFSGSGKKIGSFRTGILIQRETPSWKRYFGMFTTPNEPTMLTLQMTNTTNGGCGNDFAMDDIVFRECYPPFPVAKRETVIEKKPASEKHEIVPEKKTIAPILLKKNEQVVKNIPAAEAVVSQKKNITSAPENTGLPLPLLTRKNPIVKQIEASDGDVLVEIYDNGEIDGDTVSIYHNNELIVSHRQLSAKPISFRIKVDPSQPNHELVMVANNLGSIPPNTSLMVVTAGKKRYEVFISSSEQKNAKVIIHEKK